MRWLLVRIVEDSLGTTLPAGAEIARILDALKTQGQLEFYLLRGVRYGGRGWQLRGFRLLHVGGTEVEAASGGEIPGIEEYYPQNQPFLPDP